MKSHTDIIAVEFTDTAMIIWTSEFTFINKAFVLATNLACIIKHFKSTKTYLKQL